MALLECRLAQVVQKPLDAPPVLSIVVPTFNRADAMVMTVNCLAEQIIGGLEQRVEIIISDNGSDPETIELIKALADRWASVSYFLNARDEGGHFNLFAAPWRARGAYTWTFGSDDVLLDGGVAHVVEVLERERPSFLTLNKRVANADLSQLLTERINSVEDRRFDTFADLLCAFGINQLAFISGQIELTEAARALDAEPYLRNDSRHTHVAAFLEKHAGRPAYYSSANHLVHRVNNSQQLDYHAGNFYDYAVALPRLLWTINEKVGGPLDIFERISGYKNVTSYDAPQVTFVDNILENILRSFGFGYFIKAADRRFYEQVFIHCRPDRVEQFGQLWDYAKVLDRLTEQFSSAEAALKQAKTSALETSAVFTRPTAP
jgi:glycosyltransferase involved in cell wall biosynthesis